MVEISENYNITESYTFKIDMRTEIRNKETET